MRPFHAFNILEVLMKTFSRLRAVLIIILSIVFLVALIQTVCVLLDRKQANDTYEDLQKLVVVEDTEPSETDSPTTKDFPETTPQKEQNTFIEVDFKTLQEKYPDVVAWLYCEGTPINYPVAQGKDNNQYLRHLLSGEYNTAGTLFADYRNAVIGQDANYVIYGHNMKDGTMFSSLIKYKQQAYYDEHPVVYLLTPDKSYCIELLAGYVTSVDSDAYKLDFDTVEQMDKYVAETIKKSTFKTNAEYEPGDRLITFSTCSYEYINARYVLVGLMKEI